MAAKKPVYTTTFVLYCREAGGAWAKQGEWDEASEFEALSAAHEADDQAKWQAVRLMNVRTYPDGRAPQETIAWMTGIPRAGAVKAKGRPGGEPGGGETGTPGASPAASGKGGGNGGAAAGAKTEVQAIAGHDAGPKKKRRKKAEEQAGAAYKKLAKMHLEAAGAIGGSSSVAKAAKEAAEKEADAEKSKQAPMAAVVTRLITVFIIASVITFGAKIPLDLAHKKIAASAFDIPGLMVAGYIVVFALSALILSKILMKKGDLDVLARMFDRMQDRQDEEEDDSAQQNSLAGWRNEAGGGRTADLADEVEAEGAEAEAEAGQGKSSGAGPSGLDYPPDVVPAEPRKSMLKFLELALGAIRQQISKLDKLGKFGLNLYLAGAGDQLAKHNGLDGAQRNGMISEAIVAIGTKKAMTGPFCDKFSEFEKDSKSKAMIDAGRSAMQRFIDGDTKAFSELPSIIEGFTSNKAAKASAQGVVVVMFTDLVGSTKMTQELGDLGAQQVVRTHNAIVRNALAAYHGREVKHTGDGIMAVFSNAANAVGATMVMQQELAKHSATPGALPVKVRIGLNAGAAVQEEDDFFGTTVQLSARVCDKAGAEQIFVTQSVRDLVTGHAIQFKPAGNFDMKGIDKPVPVFEVVWSGALQATG